MGLIAKDPDKNLPPGYKVFRDSGIPRELFPFPGGEARVHRFAHRYRLAQEFQRAEFETYTHGTALAYSALCKHQFAYAAFEGLRRALGVGDDLREFDPALATYPVGTWFAAVRAAPTHQRMFNFLRKHLKRGLRDECNRFMAGEPCNFLMIACAVRTSFVHGHLTASPFETAPEDTRAICGVLTEGLFAFIDSEFRARIDQTLADLEEAPQ